MNRGLAQLTSLVRQGCHALMTPQAVVLDAGGRVRPLVRQSRDSMGSLEERFDAAVNDLLALIDEADLKGKRLHLVVSDYWARPLVLPWSGKKPSDEEVDTLLQKHFQQTYGQLMDGWQWCWTVQGSRLLAVAWPGKGLTMLREGVAQRACVLASARPLAVDVASKNPIERGASWLVIMEQQSLTLVRQQDGVWEDWFVVSCSVDMAETLQLQLVRESARRQDHCRALTLLDLNGKTNLTLLRKTLGEAGWSVRVRTQAETEASMACRLSHAIAPGAPA